MEQGFKEPKPTDSAKESISAPDQKTPESRERESLEEVSGRRALATAKMRGEELNAERPSPNHKTITELAEELNISTDRVRRSVKSFLKRPGVNPEELFYLGKFNTGYCAPELAQMIRDQHSAPDRPSEKWKNSLELREELGIEKNDVLYQAVREILSAHPEWKHKGNRNVYYSPQLVEILRGKYLRPNQEWRTTSSLAEEFTKHVGTIRAEARKYKTSHPEWFNLRFGKHDEQKYAPELVRLLREKFQKIEVKPGWLDTASIARELNENYATVKKFADSFREEHSDWFDSIPSKRGWRGESSAIYAPELVKRIYDFFSSHKPPKPGWHTISFLSHDLKKSDKAIGNIVNVHRKSNPEWFSQDRIESGIHEHLAPELIDLIKKTIEDRGNIPEGWVSPPNLAEMVHTDKSTIWFLANQYKKSHPEWFRRGEAADTRSKVRTFYLAPELVEIIKKHFQEKQETREIREKEDILGRKLKNILEGESLEAQEFKKLVGLFGGARAMDILFKFRPEFKGLPVPYVKSMIADYIGDFLVLRHDFGGKDIADAIKYLDDPSLQEGLLEVMKESCLEHYHAAKKADPTQDNYLIIAQYIQGIRQETGALQNTDLTTVINDLEHYYQEILAIQKPARMVDAIRQGREFPDLNQRINMKELGEKKRLLIADEMGLGKSASAILAKESLGVKQALMIAPSNVIDTWRNYLENYFKPDQRPSYLIIDSLEALKGDLSSYEYILISQERLNDDYTKELLKLSPDMLIVDEVHKLKNITEGIRAENLIALAQKIEDANKYLAILSGTPVPNKIADVAMILKLLYPKQFEKIDNKDMVESIIHGDLIDLRSLLIPHMQMKSLRESLEMPQYVENPPTNIELSDIEKDIYGVLLEEDELTATQKIQLLRQFLLNPEIIDATPGIPSAKFAALEKELQSDFQKVNKIVVFVNGYVEDVIRGEHSIIPKLALPSDVTVRIIEGNVSKKEREEIERELNTSDKKILLVVSGQTADVGVDFSGGEMVYFFNEPWTKYDQAQQLARVYRPGLKHDLESKTFITGGTIEEGIHRFIALKQRSIEKLLKGVPLTELDQDLLKQTEKQLGPNLEVNPELAEYYFNSWDRLMRIFGEVREIGEEGFMSYIEQYGREMTHGEEYAKAYFDLGNRSYQSNANRIAGSLIRNFITEAGQDVKDLRVLDLASGPEMFKKHGPDELADKTFSLDINPAHFARSEGSNRVVGALTTVPFTEKSFDYINLTFALHYSRFVPSRSQYERLEIFKEMNRVLKPGGRAIVDLVHSVDFKDFESFKENVKLLGFEVVENYTGVIESGNRYKSKVITLEKMSDLPADFSVEKFVKAMTKDQINGFKFQDVKGKLKDSRRIIKEFNIGDRTFEIEFNSSDKKVYQEEQKIIETGEGMKQTHNGIENIPANEIIDNMFIRFRPRDSYRLFKRLRVAEGGVVIK